MPLLKGIYALTALYVGCGKFVYEKKLCTFYYFYDNMILPLSEGEKR